MQGEGKSNQFQNVKRTQKAGLPNRKCQQVENLQLRKCFQSVTTASLVVLREVIRMSDGIVDIFKYVGRGGTEMYAKTIFLHVTGCIRKN